MTDAELSAELQQGVVFLMHLSYPTGRRLVSGCSPWIEQTYNRLVDLGLLAKTVTAGSHGKQYVTYTLAR